MSFFPSHASAGQLKAHFWTFPKRLLHRLSDTIGYGNLPGPLDLIIIEILAFLTLSFTGFLVLEITRNFVSEDTKRLTCLYTPAIIAFLPGIYMNNRHRLAIAIDRFLLTGDSLSVNPRLSVRQAFQLGGQLMDEIKRRIGYNRQPACKYMKNDYPHLLDQVVQNIRLAALEANDHMEKMAA